jgi:hypothetical protein
LLFGQLGGDYPQVYSTLILRKNLLDEFGILRDDDQFAIGAKLISVTLSLCHFDGFDFVHDLFSS